ncbi:Bax inhibitor-1/YccA family protein [Ignavibacteria bacterium]|nr:Bax inhibitor-1/YccA family protein [Bacteroidota bacterium]MCZ2132431.1 Bax inhibitor-1/YccA family protein [Bacteroidota bacterium]
MAYEISRKTAGAIAESGVQDYMTKVYGWMAGGLLTTALSSYFTISSPILLEAVFSNSIILIGLFIGQILLVGALSGWVQRMSTGVAATVFLAYSALTGLTISSIFFVYTSDSIFNVFTTVALAFAALSLFGLTTKRDISGWGSFLFIGLVGVMLSFVVDIFFPGGPFGFAATIIGVIVFAGLTVYDSARIKEQYLEIAGTDGEFLAGRFAVRGALTLYLDFINLFLLLLRLLGRRR